MKDTSRTYQVHAFAVITDGPDKGNVEKLSRATTAQEALDAVECSNFYGTFEAYSARCGDTVDPVRAAYSASADLFDNMDDCWLIDHTGTNAMFVVVFKVDNINETVVKEEVYLPYVVQVEPAWDEEN